MPDAQVEARVTGMRFLIILLMAPLASSSQFPRRDAAAEPMTSSKSEPGPQRPFRLLPDLLVVGTTLLICVPVLFYPLARDQGIFAYNTAALLDGQTPYVDFTDQKPPGIFFLYAVPLLLFGRTMWGIHVFEWVWIAATAWAAWRVGRRFGGLTAGFVTGILSGLFLSGAEAPFYHRAEVETFLTLPYAAILALFLCPAGTSRPRTAVAAGLLSGACCCLKPNAIVFPILGAAVTILFDGLEHRSGRPLAASLKTAACFAAGFTLLPASMLAWLWSLGALGTFYEHMTSINAAYLGNVWKEVIANFWYDSRVVISLGAGFLLLLFLVSRTGPANLRASLRGIFGPQGERKRRMVLVGALGAGSVAMVISGRHLFSYHYQILVLPEALTIGLALAGLAGPIVARFRRRPAVRAAGMSLLCLGVISMVAANLKTQDISFFLGRQTLRAYHESRRFKLWRFFFRDDRMLADMLVERTRPDERVQILGHGSLVLFLANRRSATRFSETTAALDPRYGRGGKDREEILARLRQDPPRIIVVAEDQGQPQLDVAPTPRQIADFPPLAKFLEENYSPDEMVGHYKVLVLTARAQRGSSGAPRGAAR
ncbi:MAG: hypothetical protein DMF49_00380 [Acidobacteria bacterium]|nr:MAG: hypothetical protein DMF49_00380 [Acidobacteriota bacterium]